MAKGKPRLDPYSRLMTRLHEAMVLVSLLPRIHLQHQRPVYNLSNVADVRRRFLKNVAFVCDYTKGGDTVTAVSVENCDDCNTFWIAANEQPDELVRQFVNSILVTLKSHSEVSASDDVEIENEIAQICIRHASKKIKKNHANLTSAIKTCVSSLRENAECEDIEIIPWLQQFSRAKTQDISVVCQHAYDKRNDLEMKLIYRLGSESETSTNSDDKPKMAFRRAYHLIGRLAAHVRIAKELLADSRRLTRLLDDFTVELVPAPPGIRQPIRDSHTTLNGVLNRFLPKDAQVGEDIVSLLLSCYDSDQLEAKILKEFPVESSKILRVHAEVQMAEHFNNGTQERRFFDGDPYIACSKPACLCCRLYLETHPSHCYFPGSHDKLYPKWGPVLLEGGAKHGKWTSHQRKIIQGVIAGLVDLAVRRTKTSLNGGFRADSLTEITRDGDDDLDFSDSDGEGFPEDPTEGWHEYISDSDRETIRGQDSDSDDDGGAGIGN
ncbi:hypothetical protein BX600DRAFT_526709 [Xylariales sp. PMI_506]|nr:hypothetical protein BX600DRAFT_526709 [Xylariales sp. PMI_506]